MNAQSGGLSHRQAQELFSARIDEALDTTGRGRLEAHLAGCAECRSGWERYARAVATVRAVPRAKAPVQLATLVARRVRRKRTLPRALVRAQGELRVPYEILVPLLLGVVVAALIVLLAP